MKETDNLENVILDRRIILKWISLYSGGVDFGGSYERGNEHWDSINCGKFHD
jgi:hypothetical protein